MSHFFYSWGVNQGLRLCHLACFGDFWFSRKQLEKGGSVQPYFFLGALTLNLICQVLQKKKNPWAAQYSLKIEFKYISAKPARVRFVICREELWVLHLFGIHALLQGDRTVIWFNPIWGPTNSSAQLTESPLEPGILPPPLVSVSSLSTLTRPSQPSFTPSNVPGLCPPSGPHTCCCFCLVGAPFGPSLGWLFVHYSELTWLHINDLSAENSFLTPQSNVAHSQLKSQGFLFHRAAVTIWYFSYLLTYVSHTPYPLKKTNSGRTVVFANTFPACRLSFSRTQWCLVKHKGLQVGWSPVDQFVLLWILLVASYL